MTLDDDERRRRNNERSRAYKRLLRSQGICINGRSHGPATHGCRCELCYIVHKRNR